MTAAELAARLCDLWATLDALGAVVDRRPLPDFRRQRITTLRASTLRPIAAREAERVRVLTSPEAAPVLAWLAWKASA